MLSAVFWAVLFVVLLSVSLAASPFLSVLSFLSLSTFFLVVAVFWVSTFSRCILAYPVSFKVFFTSCFDGTLGLSPSMFHSLVSLPMVGSKAPLLRLASSKESSTHKVISESSLVFMPFCASALIFETTLLSSRQESCSFSSLSSSSFMSCATSFVPYIFSLKTVLMTKSVLLYSCGEVVDVEVSAVVCSDADFVFFLSEEHAVIDKSRQPAIIIDKICFFILDIPFLVFHYWNIPRY